MWIVIIIGSIVAVIWIVAILKILWLICKGIYYMIFDIDMGYYHAIKKRPDVKAFEDELDNLIKNNQYENR